MINNAANRVCMSMGVDAKDLQFLSHLDILDMLQGKPPRKQERTLLSAADAEAELEKRYG